MPNNSHKKILFLINSLAVGGAERVFVHDANALHERGWQVYVATLFAGGPLETELRIPGGHIYALRATSVFDRRATRALRELIYKEDIATLYTTLNEANIFGRLAALGTRVALFTREANMAGPKPLKYKLLDVLLGWRSKRIVAVSRAVRRSVAVYLPWLMPRMTVLYNGVAVPAVIPKRTADEGQVRLLCVASLSKKKDQAILLHAFTLLPRVFTLTLVGEGKERTTLESLAKELDIAERIQFAGYRGGSELEEAYRTHDIFVLPSKHEGCPNVISEAQSFALPVVAFAVPGMSEFVSEWSGVLVKERTPAALAAGLRRAADLRVRGAMGEAGYREVAATRSAVLHTQALIKLLC